MIYAKELANGFTNYSHMLIFRYLILFLSKKITCRISYP